MKALGLPSLEQLDHFRELNDINEKEFDTASKLLDVGEAAQTQPINEDSFALVNAAVDSLCASCSGAPTGGGAVVHSVEAFNIDIQSVLKKIKDLVLRILKAVVESFQRSWKWVRDSYRTSKDAREKIRRRLYVLNQQLKDFKNHKDPILVIDFDRASIPELLVGGQAPKNLEADVNALHRLINSLQLDRFGKEILDKVSRLSRSVHNPEETEKIYKEVTKLLDSTIGAQLEGKPEGQKMHQGQSADITNYGSFLGSFSLRRISYTDKQKSHVSFYTWRHDVKKMRAGQYQGEAATKHQKTIEAFIKVLNDLDGLYEDYQKNVLQLTFFEKLINDFIKEFEQFYSNPKYRERTEKYRTAVNSSKLMYGMVRSYMEMPLFLFTRVAQVSLTYTRLMEAEVAKLYRQQA